ncbi:lysophospholipid acyltransferase family protein [Pelagibaculum spongiae]|nr:1-acyl-sn-glycerol-3-phosphate acyltransferase [Pelagibaculum spongiae]
MINRLLIQATIPIKLLLIVFLLIYGYFLAIYVAIVKCPQQQRRLQLKLARHWQQLFLKIIGVKVKTFGQALQPGSLVVSNHISWLDIVITGSQQSVFFLAKSEVRQWPLIGKLATLAGTLFINRQGHCSRSINRQIAESLHRQQSVLIYAEGTSSDGQSVLNFHPKLFSSAIIAKKPIQPILIQYFTGQSADYQIAPFIGDDTFHQHLFRLLAAPPITAHIHYLPCINSELLTDENNNARILAQQSCISIRAKHQHSRHQIQQPSPVKALLDSL